MLYLPDSNILIYAKMAAMTEHAAAIEWLTTALNDQNSTILICETSILSFLRITTNQKAFDPPLPYTDAVSFTTDLLTRTNVQVHKPSPGHFIEVAEFMKKNGLGGNFVMDIHLAILAMNTGSVLVSRDRDFKKIPYLKTLNPL